MGGVKTEGKKKKRKMIEKRIRRCLLPIVLLKLIVAKTRIVSAVFLQGARSIRALVPNFFSLVRK